ncbi:MAG TPA: DUF2085 domain-containing protein [Thermomicrobiales bacterium]|nr:DUF2085 domain-containing protein [Thermomicrobiales bacterium]
MMADPAQSSTMSPRAQAIAGRIDAAVFWFATHWLAVFVGYGATILGLASLAPILRGDVYDTASRFIYLPFRLICHQRDDRSFHLHGEQMAFCERDVAIVSAAVLTGVIFAIIRRWRGLPRLGFAVVVLLALPMAVDGGTQLVGLRESTPALRVLTGTLFSLGVGWFVLPHLDTGFASMRDEISCRHSVYRNEASTTG